MNKSSKENLSQFSADFVKIFVSGVGLGLVILGYSYTHTFFGNFGLPLFQLKMEWVDIFFRGIALIQDFRVASISAAIIFIGSIIFSARNIVGTSAKIAITSFTILGFVSVATWGGQNLGSIHARAIWENGAGKKAFCRFNSEIERFDGLAAKLDQLSKEERIRLIYQSKDHTFLAPVYKIVTANQTAGEAYVIPTSSIAYCRIVGS